MVQEMSFIRIGSCVPYESFGDWYNNISRVPSGIYKDFMILTVIEIPYIKFLLKPQVFSVIQFR